MADYAASGSYGPGPDVVLTREEMGISEEEYEIQKALGTLATLPADEYFWQYGKHKHNGFQDFTYHILDDYIGETDE